MKKILVLVFLPLFLKASPTITSDSFLLFKTLFLGITLGCIIFFIKQICLEYILQRHHTYSCYEKYKERIISLLKDMSMKEFSIEYDIIHEELENYDLNINKELTNFYDQQEFNSKINSFYEKISEQYRIWLTYNKVVKSAVNLLHHMPDPEKINEEVNIALNKINNLVFDKENHDKLINGLTKEFNSILPNRNRLESLLEMKEFNNLTKQIDILDGNLFMYRNYLSYIQQLISTDETKNEKAITAKKRADDYIFILTEIENYHGISEESKEICKKNKKLINEAKRLKEETPLECYNLYDVINKIWQDCHSAVEERNILKHKIRTKLKEEKKRNKYQI